MKSVIDEDASEFLIHFEPFGARDLVSGIKERPQIIMEYQVLILRLGVDRNIWIPTFK